MATRKTKAAEPAAKPTATKQSITIKPLNFETIQLSIEGTSPYVQHKFSEKAKQQIMDTQREGSRARTKKKREPKDFKKVYEDATHRSAEGWCGIPAPAFRNAAISACRTVGFKMTHAKLGFSVEADGFDPGDGMPLVKITKGRPRMHIAPARNDNGSIDIRARPMWESWQAKLRVQYDADMFTRDDIVNLIVRVGAQVGIGEGRPDSKKSAGLGWGLFRVL